MRMAEQDIMVSPESYFEMVEAWKRVRGLIRWSPDDVDDPLRLTAVENLDQFFGIEDDGE
jgi:hypothetical protein